MNYYSNKCIVPTCKVRHYQGSKAQQDCLKQFEKNKKNNNTTIPRKNNNSFQEINEQDIENAHNEFKKRFDETNFLLLKAGIDLSTVRSNGLNAYKAHNFAKNNLDYDSARIQAKEQENLFLANNPDLESIIKALKSFNKFKKYPELGMKTQKEFIDRIKDENEKNSETRKKIIKLLENYQKSGNYYHKIISRIQN